MSKKPEKNDGKKVSVLRIKRLRGGGSLVDMSKKIGITHPYLSLIERGYGISLEMRDLICKWYDLTPKEAFRARPGGKRFVAVML